MGRRKKERILKTCLECHDEFYVIPYRGDKARYCSKKCYGLSRSGEKRPKWIGEKISKIKKGKPLTEEHKKILSQVRLNNFRLGKIPKINNGSFKKGNVPWSKGTKGLIKVSEEAKEKKKKWAKENHPERHLKKYLEERGTSWNKGKPFSKKVRKNMSNSQLKRFEELGPECHPNWQGGKSFEPYPITFNIQFKRKVRKRDEEKCLVCGRLQEKLNRKCDVHHIDYNKENTIESNCISLCRSCHVITNSNREYWTIFFQDLLSKKYGYKY